MESVRYLVLCLALGALSVWASENLFWFMPPEGLRLWELAITILAYSIAAGVALSAVIWSGLGGMAGAFLAGCILGLMSEGVIVGTIYRAFPLQLIWTPLSWHGAITGGLVLGLARAPLGLGARLALWSGLGLAGAYWGQYWTFERDSLPDWGLLALYLAGFGLVVPLAHRLMDRMGHLPRPARWVLWIAPGIAAAVWVLQSLYDPIPTRVVLPLMLGGILWVMWRLGGAGPVALGQSRGILWFLLAPALMVALAPLGWAQGWGTLEANWVVAGLSSLVALVWAGRLVWRAVRQPSARIAAPRSIAPS